MTDKRILIIDDEKDVVSMLAARLSASGYQVLCAYDGKQGIEQAETVNPDLIILDVMMPKINGYTICSILKGHPEHKAIPIIMLTARDQPEDKIFNEHFKPERYITKPFDAEKLLAEIHTLIR